MASIVGLGLCKPAGSKKLCFFVVLPFSGKVCGRGITINQFEFRNSFDLDMGRFVVVHTACERSGIGAENGVKRAEN